MDISNHLARLADKIDDEGGRFSVVADTAKDAPERWMVGFEWGEETPGSSMYAGASYGTGSTLEVALAQVVAEVLP